MSNKHLYLICISVIVVIIVGTIVFNNVIKPNNPDDPIVTSYSLHKDFIKVDRDYETRSMNRIEKNYVFTNYQEYSEYFDDHKLGVNDFADNNYVLIYLDYDGCSERDILPTDYKIDGNNLEVTVKYRSTCGVCAPDQEYYLLKVDKSITQMNVKINSIVVSRETCMPGVAYKPIIYLYPNKKTNVNVKLVNSDLITVSYPKYNNSWDVTAYPNGKLIDNQTHRELYGLYWEGKNYSSKFTNEGFVVKGEDTIKFLEEKLSVLGLTERESNEFIIYWLPKLENNKYNYIRFEDINTINSYMPLEVTPTPDTIIRVYMNYMPLDKYVSVKEQRLESVTRKGFTLVEWGGSEILK